MMVRKTKVPQISDERKIVDRCNALARDFYQMHGYVVDEGYRFDQATHPQERGMWNMAMHAFEVLEGADVQDCLYQLEEDVTG